MHLQRNFDMDTVDWARSRPAAALQAPRPGSLGLLALTALNVHSLSWCALRRGVTEAAVRASAQHSHRPDGRSAYLFAVRPVHELRASV